MRSCNQSKTKKIKSTGSLLKVQPIHLLYGVQIAFILGTLLTVLLALHKSTLIFIFTLIPSMILFLSLIQKEIFLKSKYSFLFLFIFIFIYLIFINSTIDRTTLFTLFCVMSLYMFMEHNKLYMSDFIRFVNITYFLYLFFSLILYFIYYDLSNANMFVIEFFGFHINTIVGILGSTANIDFYTVLVLLLNLFFNMKQSKYFLIILLFFIIFWTNRSTPLVAMLFSGIIYLFIRNKFFAGISLVVFFVALAVVMMLVYLHADITYGEYGFEYIMYRATHGRNIIWALQIENILNNFSSLDYLVGHFTYAPVEVDWVDYMVENSHNSYLMNFFHAGISFFILLGTYFVIFLRKKFNRKKFAVLMAILTAALTNSEIFLMVNPIYIIVMIYLVTGIDDMYKCDAVKFKTFKV